jgi:hypothetical protein
MAQAKFKPSWFSASLLASVSTQVGGKFWPQFAAQCSKSVQSLLIHHVGEREAGVCALRFIV